MKQNKESTVQPHHRLSIRWKLAIYFSGFMALTLLFLFLFQTFFLETFYENMKIQTIKSAAQSVVDAASEEDVQTVMATWAMQEQMSVRLVTADGISLFSETDVTDFQHLNTADLQRLYTQTEENGGTLLQRHKLDFGSSDNKNDPPKSEKPAEKPDAADTGNSNELKQPEGEKKNDRQNRTSETLLYTQMCQSADGTACMAVVTSLITPVDATLKTLQTQLLIAAAVLIVAALILAWLLSKKIADPIIGINHSAKVLASGNYTVPFTGGGYKEIDELRDTLNETAVELAKSDTLQKELIANISHDLRTPLTMITGYSEAIRDLPGENSAENIQVVIDEANRLTRLVNDVLDLSKLQSGTQQLSMLRMSLTGAVRETVARCARLTEQEGYTISFEADGEADVYADELKISQVIYNLLGNAITYTGEDKHVTVTQTLSGNSVRISFTDSGSGIPPEQQENIWERYYKIDKSHRRSALGTGLGLSIVRSLVDLHGGTCGVDSAVGEGSTFWFELPLAEQES